MTDNPHEPGAQPAEGIANKGCLNKIVKTFVALCVLAFLVTLLIPAVSQPNSAIQQRQCKHNLKLITLAMHNYHDDHGHFPPAYTVDEHGHRLHSWRTLILPYIEEAELFAKVDFTEPWSHPSNSEARATCPTTFRCKSARLPEGYTSYKAIIGADAAFPPDGGTRSFDDFKDGTSNTLLLIETSPDQSTHWMNPHDDDAVAFLAILSSKPPTAHIRGVQTALADGSVRYLSFDTPPEKLTALRTYAGGEVINANEF